MIMKIVHRGLLATKIVKNIPLKVTKNILKYVYISSMVYSEDNHENITCGFIDTKIVTHVVLAMGKLKLINTFCKFFRSLSFKKY